MGNSTSSDDRLSDQLEDVIHNIMSSLSPLLEIARLRVQPVAEIAFAAILVLGVSLYIRWLVRRNWFHSQSALVQQKREDVDSSGEDRLSDPPEDVDISGGDRLSDLPEDVDSSGGDRLSDLPEGVIHNIMSFLSPRDLAHLSVLSKRLSLMWLSVSDLNLDCTHSDWNKRKDEFLIHALTTLSRRRRCLDPTLRSLSLCLFINRNNCSEVNNWVAAPLLELVSDIVVPDLSVHIHKYRASRPYLRFVLSSSWLSSVKLRGLRLPDQEFVVACPVLRHFHLRSCYGSYDRTAIRFTRAAKLIQSVSVIQCSSIKSICIDQDSPAGLLEFSFVAMRNYHEKIEDDPCKIDVFNAASCKSLKVLEMTLSGTVTRDWLREEVSKLVSLEKLGLRSCRGVDNIFVGNPKLKHLVLECSKSTSAIQVAVPGLESLSFKLEGSFRQKINIDACRSLRRVEILGGAVDTPRMIETLVANSFLESLKLRYFNFNASSVPLDRCHSTLTNVELPVSFLRHEQGSLSEVQTRFRDFLNVFGLSNTLNLVVGTEVEMCVYPKTLRDALNPPLKEVRTLNITNLPDPCYWDIMVELVDTLLWLAPRLHTLSISDDMGRTIFTIKFHRANTQHNDFEMKCCSTTPNKCWRHDLIEVVIENIESYRYQERLHKYIEENVNIKVTKASPENINQKIFSCRYSEVELSQMKLRDRIFI